LVVPFPGAGRTTVAEVGGKAYSLIRMLEAGLSVPPGAVLTTEFFAPWFDEIRASATWMELSEASPDRWPLLCSELKWRCLTFPLTAAQGQAFTDLRGVLAALGGDALFAVRSSSPEEDLASASFAGGYETGGASGGAGERGATLLRFEPRCACACLQEEHGLDVWSPRIAVIVQQQVDSQTAGVGFSLNPLTNDYDEAVIDANWGLGESVVAGSASPDHFVVDKVSRRVVEAKLGAKQVSTWLGSDGGTVEREHRSADLTLAEAQLGELVHVLCRVEELFGCPVDIEWAFAGGRLHLLQARPITTYLPLPVEMVTKPGERRRLYADAGLSQGLTINEPISPLGLAWMVDVLYSSILKRWAGIDDFTPAGGLVFAAGCRFYMNVSNAMWLGMTPRMMARNAAATDALLAEILGSVDAKRYRAVRRPPWLRFGLLLLLPRACGQCVASSRTR
jgi:pyruvate,water dikinase